MTIVPTFNPPRSAVGMTPGAVPMIDPTAIYGARNQPRVDADETPTLPTPRPRSMAALAAFYYDGTTDADPALIGSTKRGGER